MYRIFTYKVNTFRNVYFGMFIRKYCHLLLAWPGWQQVTVLV